MPGLAERLSFSRDMLEQAQPDVQSHYFREGFALMESMTGFGNASVKIDAYIVTVLCRSVNNRGLSVNARMPRQALHLEREVAGMARDLFRRGRIDINVSIEAGEEASLPRPDAELAGAYLKAAEKLASEFYLTSSPDAFALVTLPGVMRTPDIPGGKDLDSLIGSVCGSALEDLLSDRRSEGSVLEGVFRKGLDTISELAVPVGEGHSSRVKEIFQQRRDRLSELLDAPVSDEYRLAQELALLSDRMDISEESTRLAAHLDAAREILPGHHCGRKLDFLLQEMHRELNTMGAKVDNTGAVHAIINMKDVLGGLREQAANVQ